LETTLEELVAERCEKVFAVKDCYKKYTSLLYAEKMAILNMFLIFRNNNREHSPGWVDSLL
jgi:hypothetical protein